jgi:branched-subunit amino acid transport protein
MSALVVVLLAGLGTYLLRASFVVAAGWLTIPASVQRVLRHSPPAVLAAILATGVAGDGGLPALVRLTPVTGAAAVALLAAVGSRSLLRPVLAGMTAIVLLEALWP